ncbi:unnamed protein product [Pleuronectes platessa]|uniref:Uncharacterized protein n=1 Tax=Pleuronectes platessa TaxID=8262 RepID=A0A9N7V6G7_PLEPL|nr:unnamed protein product [Pleuronectes platessa]
MTHSGLPAHNTCISSPYGVAVIQLMTAGSCRRCPKVMKVDDYGDCPLSPPFLEIEAIVESVRQLGGIPIALSSERPEIDGIIHHSRAPLDQVRKATSCLSAGGSMVKNLPDTIKSDTEEQKADCFSHSAVPQSCACPESWLIIKVNLDLSVGYVSGCSSKVNEQRVRKDRQVPGTPGPEIARRKD